jgi:hypothetical protein
MNQILSNLDKNRSEKYYRNKKKILLEQKIHNKMRTKIDKK